MIFFTQIIPKGSKMSKLDYVQQEKVFLQVNETHKDALNIDAKLFNDNTNHGLDDMHLEAWMEIFEEDQVTVEGCK